MNYSTIILAAGKGSRTNLEYNKVFYTFQDGQTVLEKSMSFFLKDEDCKQIILVVAQYEKASVEEKYKVDNRVEVVIGGKTRQESVYNGLQVVDQDYVMIHDGARPYLQDEWIDTLKKELKTYNACLLMVPSVDTTKVVEDGFVKETLKRETIYHAQTPQAFKTTLIQACHEKGKGQQATDDAQLVEWYSNEKIKVVLSSFTNKKITLPEDLQG